MSREGDRDRQVTLVADAHIPASFFSCPWPNPAYTEHTDDSQRRLGTVADGTLELWETTTYASLNVVGWGMPQRNEGRHSGPAGLSLVLLQSWEETRD